MFKKCKVKLLVNKLTVPLLQSNFNTGTNKPITVTVKDFPWLRLKLLKTSSFYTFTK